MEVLAALEQSGFARLLKTSFYVYPVVSALHIASVGTLLTCVWLMDARILGLLRSLPGRPFVAAMRRVALVAFAGALGTGISLFSVRATEYADLPVFLVKMVLIVLAGINLAAFLLVGRSRVADTGASTGLKATAALSACLWTGVLLAGRFIGFA